MMFKQKGNSTVVALGVTGALAVGAASYTYEGQVEKPLAQSKLANQEVIAIQEAANKYRFQYGDWPENMQELKDGVAYAGKETSPFGSVYQLTVDGDVLSVTFDTYSEYATATMQGMLRGANRIDGDTIASSINPPPESAMTSYFVARKEIPGCPDCNTLEDSIDAGNNDINNLKLLQSERGEFDAINSDELSTDEMTVKARLDVGTNSSISPIAGGIAVTSPSVTINGNTTIGGNLDMMGNDVQGVRSLDAVDIEAVSAAIKEARIDRLEGDELLYAVGVIDALSGQNLTFDQAFLNQVVSNEAVFQQFQVDVLNGVAANFTTAIINNATAQLVSSQQWQTTNLTVSQTADIANGNIDYLDVIQAVSNTLTAQLVTANNTVTEYFDSVNLTVNGRATMSEVVATSAEASYADLADFYADAFKVNGNFTVNGRLTSGSADISGETRTNELRVNGDSDLGQATADRLVVSGTASAQKLVGASGEINGPLTVDDVNGQSASFNQIYSDRYDGGMFYGDNFVTPITSTNKNHQLLKEFEGLWKTCVDEMNCK